MEYNISFVFTFMDVALGFPFGKFDDKVGKMHTGQDALFKQPGFETTCRLLILTESCLKPPS